MAAHVARIERYIPKGEKNPRYVAICSCGRWRSEGYRDRSDAETKALAHETQGDEHIRALAALGRGSASLRSSYRWYVEQSEDPFLDEEQRAMWRRLADELRPRVQGATREADEPLW